MRSTGLLFGGDDGGRGQFLPGFRELVLAGQNIRTQQGQFDRIGPERRQQALHVFPAALFGRQTEIVQNQGLGGPETGSRSRRRRRAKYGERLRITAFGNQQVSQAHARRFATD